MKPVSRPHLERGQQRARGTVAGGTFRVKKLQEEIEASVATEMGQQIEGHGSRGQRGGVPQRAVAALGGLED